MNPEAKILPKILRNQFCQAEFILETKEQFNTGKPIHVNCQNSIFKTKNDTTILIDADKALNKFQHQFMIKTGNKQNRKGYA